jgi:hypothetical protein
MPQHRHTAFTKGHSASGTLSHARRLLVLALGIGYASVVSAQTVGSPILPRGGILFDVGGSFAQVTERWDDDQRPLGFEGFDRTLDPLRFPALEAEFQTLRSLIGPGAPPLSAGRLQGRFEVNEQQIPIRLGYGVLDRVAVAVTVPMVRRRVDAHLQTSGEGANLGLNPAKAGGSSASAVAAFRGDAARALSELRAAVEARCTAEGAGSSSCQAGRTTEAELAGFLGELNAAWNGLDLFPLIGSPAGAALQARWNGFRTQFSTWSTTGPELIPLAQSLGGAPLQSRLSDPIWGTDGFPSTTPEAIYVLGDVELHLAVGLLGSGASLRNPVPARGGLALRSAVEGTLRLGTGTVDSFAVFTPLEGVMGHGGFGARWVTDLLIEGRFGILAELGWQTFSEASGTLLAADPTNGWNPAAARVQGTGAPGDRIRISVTPRFILARGVSLGGGFELLRGGESRWTFESLAAGEGELSTPFAETRVLPAWSATRGVAELRFAGWDGPALFGVPFPAEVTVRGLHAVGGAGDAPGGTRLELGARVIRRR